MANHNNVLPFPAAAHPRQAGRLLIPERLTEARRAARLTQTELADRIGKTRQSVSAYEAGEKSPEPPVLDQIALELGQPISYFTKPSRSSFGKHSANFFRKKGADTKRRNLACAVLAEWFASSAFAFDAIAKYPNVDIPRFEPGNASTHSYSESEIEDIAEKVRQHFGLGLGPISNVLRLLETKGIIICRYVIPNENIEAFSFWSGERPFIFLSSEKESATRARFDLAHELFHLCAHRWVGEEELDDDNRLRQIEEEADRFAGAFLLPRRSFPNEVYSSRAESFINLKARWKVSIQAMVYRCKDLGLFDDRQITNIYKQISYKKWRTYEPLDRGQNAIAFEVPMLLRRVAEVVFQSGRYRVDELKADLALSDATLEQLIGIPFVTEPPPTEPFVPTLK
jgi:Zn-dependent peptidase ImmA (M78 family)/transcriptional regulator with XRE-family HTH domain